MTELTFNREYEFRYCTAQEIAPGLRRVVARNPSAFTFYGTGTYIVGHKSVAVIDPGPASQEHIDAVLEAVADCTVSHILVTHTHLDHSPASRAVAAATSAPCFAFGPHGSGNGGDEIQVEEGADWEFEPDVRVAHGDVVENEEWSFECVYTPGHTSNHMCFAWRETNSLFCGDHVMGWNSTIVSPPDGNMTDYIASLDLLLEREDTLYYPTHGSPIDNPHEYVRALRAHRLARAEQILAGLAVGTATAWQLAERLYTHLPREMLGAASRAVLATLIYLQAQDRVQADHQDLDTARWHSLE
ncbi:MAG: MBL fold metallo-hydrolase [Pseudomonadota bacterium]